MSSSDPHVFTDKFDVDSDFRGETLTYIESGRRAQMMWTWNSSYTVYGDTLDSWLDADGSRTPLTDEERKTILERVVKYAQDVQHVKMKVE
jgi:hypothetical protein